MASHFLPGRAWGTLATMGGLIFQAGESHSLQGPNEAKAPLHEQPERDRERERGVWRWVPVRWNRPSACRGAGARRRAAPRTAGSRTQKAALKTSQHSRARRPTGAPGWPMRPTAEEAALGFGVESGSGEEPHGS